MHDALVVIGHFGMPGVVELQLKLLARHCPGAAVLVTDDRTDEAFDPAAGETAADGRARYARLKAVCKAGGAKLVTCARERCRHAGGDLGAFYWGLRVAEKLGLRYVCKLSQRLLIDRPGWLAEWAGDMRDPGVRAWTGAAVCRYGLDVRFRVRSECVLMDRSAGWDDPGLAAELAPRPLNGVAAESLLWEAMARRGLGRFCAPRFLPDDRHQPSPGVLWHDADSLAAYRATAAREDVDLGPEFHAGGQRQTRGWAGD